MIENSPQLMSDIEPQIPKTQRAPKETMSKNIPRHIIFKLQKIKDFFFNCKRNQRKNTPYLCNKAKVTSDFLETV